MLPDAEKALDRILELVAKCPEPLRERCFEVLLTAYVQRAMPVTQNAPEPAAVRQDDKPAGSALPVPDSVRPRLQATAARLKIAADKLAALFDFQADPFTFHALAVPGDSKAAKVRNVALLLAAKGYLANGAWSADWKEFKAMCVDQSCYDRTNVGKYLSSEPYFKTSSATENITLSSGGITAAEKLLTGIVEPKTD